MAEFPGYLRNIITSSKGPSLALRVRIETGRKLLNVLNIHTRCLMVFALYVILDLRLQ